MFCPRSLDSGNSFAHKNDPYEDEKLSFFVLLPLYHHALSP
ncbi:hypothetical protein EVA_16385 [gut metagenome]|uniref:Uncharacterized protein n=1 Tax=gut metagenome TaxID=749906 RepID=J9FM56_9ZZZZ